MRRSPTRGASATCKSPLAPGNSCTANDVTFILVGLGDQTNGCVTPTDTVSIFMGAKLQNTSGQTRYDIGLFVYDYLGAGDPTPDAYGGRQCAVEALKPVYGTAGTSTCGPLNLSGGSGPFYNDDGDTCGDLVKGQCNSADVFMKFTSAVTIPCTDSIGANGSTQPDGFVDIPTCATWGNSSNQVGPGGTCTDETSVHPGTGAKCNCADPQFGHPGAAAGPLLLLHPEPGAARAVVGLHGELHQYRAGMHGDRPHDDRRALRMRHGELPALQGRVQLGPGAGAEHRRVAGHADRDDRRHRRRGHHQQPGGLDAEEQHPLGHQPGGHRPQRVGEHEVPVLCRSDRPERDHDQPDGDHVLVQHRTRGLDERGGPGPDGELQLRRLQPGHLGPGLLVRRAGGGRPGRGRVGDRGRGGHGGVRGRAARSGHRPVRPGHRAGGPGRRAAPRRPVPAGGPRGPPRPAADLSPGGGGSARRAGGLRPLPGHGRGEGLRLPGQGSGPRLHRHRQGRVATPRPGGRQRPRIAKAAGPRPPARPRPAARGSR